MSINCNVHGQNVDENRCFNHWPQYPCYDPRTRTCNSPDGVQLFDPVSDMYYGASGLYLSVLNFADQLLSETPARDRSAVDRSIRRTIHDWAPSFIGGPRPLTFSGDGPLETSIPLIQASEQIPGRYYTMQDLVSGVGAIGTHLATARDTIRNYRDRLHGINVSPSPFLPANPLQRRDSEEIIASGTNKSRKRKKKKKRKKKRRKTRKK